MGDASTIHPYDLDQRTPLFRESIIDFAKRISILSVVKRLISQLVGAGTSICTNYRESDNAASQRDCGTRDETCVMYLASRLVSPAPMGDATGASRSCARTTRSRSAPWRTGSGLLGCSRSTRRLRRYAVS